MQKKEMVYKGNLNELQDKDINSINNDENLHKILLNNLIYDDIDINNNLTKENIINFELDTFNYFHTVKNNIFLISI